MTKPLLVALATIALLASTLVAQQRQPPPVPPGGTALPPSAALTFNELLTKELEQQAAGITGVNVGKADLYARLIVRNIFVGQMQTFIGQLNQLKALSRAEKLKLIQDLLPAADELASAYQDLVAQEATTATLEAQQRGYSAATEHKTLTERAERLEADGDKAGAAEARATAARRPHGRFLELRTRFYALLDQHPLLGLIDYSGLDKYFFQSLLTRLPYGATDDERIALLDRVLDWGISDGQAEVDRVLAITTYDGLQELGGPKYERQQIFAIELGARFHSDLTTQLMAGLVAVYAGEKKTDAASVASVDLWLGIAAGGTFFIPGVGPLISGGITAVIVTREGSDLVMTLLDEDQARASAGVTGFTYVITAEDRARAERGQFVFTLMTSLGDLAAIKNVRVTRGAAKAGTEAADAATAARRAADAAPPAAGAAPSAPPSRPVSGAAADPGRTVTDARQPVLTDPNRTTVDPNQPVLTDPNRGTLVDPAQPTLTPPPPEPPLGFRRARSSPEADAAAAAERERAAAGAEAYDDHVRESDVVQAADDVREETRLAREAGVAETLVDALTRRFDPAGSVFENWRIATRLLRVRLVKLGYRLYTTRAEWRYVTEMWFRARDGKLTPTDLAWIQRQGADFYDRLPKTGKIFEFGQSPVTGQARPKEGFVPVIDEAGAKMLKQWVEGAKARAAAPPTIPAPPATGRTTPPPATGVGGGGQKGTPGAVPLGAPLGGLERSTRDTTTSSAGTSWAAIGSDARARVAALTDEIRTKHARLLELERVGANPLVDEDRRVEALKEYYQLRAELIDLRVRRRYAQAFADVGTGSSGGSSAGSGAAPSTPSPTPSGTTTGGNNPPAGSGSVGSIPTNQSNLLRAAVARAQREFGGIDDWRWGPIGTDNDRIFVSTNERSPTKAVEAALHMVDGQPVIRFVTYRQEDGTYFQEKRELANGTTLTRRTEFRGGDTIPGGAFGEPIPTDMQRAAPATGTGATQQAPSSTSSGTNRPVRPPPAAVPQFTNPGGNASAGGGIGPTPSASSANVWESFVNRGPTATNITPNITAPGLRFEYSLNNAFVTRVSIWNPGQDVVSQAQNANQQGSAPSWRELVLAPLARLLQPSVPFASRAPWTTRTEAAASIAAGQPGATAVDPTLKVFVTTVGSIPGKAFKMVVVSERGAPVHLSSEPFVLEPVQRVTAQEIDRELQRLSKFVKATTTIDAYCLEIAKLPPAVGTVFRIADQAKQQRYEAVRPVMKAAEDLMTAKRLVGGQGESYLHAARQWAVWALQERFDENAFRKAFIDHAKQNIAAARRPWTRELEASVGQALPARWQDVTLILETARRSGVLRQ